MLDFISLLLVLNWLTHQRVTMNVSSNILTHLFFPCRVKVGSITSHSGKTLHSNLSYFWPSLVMLLLRVQERVCAYVCVFYGHEMGLMTCTDIQTNGARGDRQSDHVTELSSNLTDDVHEASKYKILCC